MRGRRSLPTVSQTGTALVDGPVKKQLAPRGHSFIVFVKKELLARPYFSKKKHRPESDTVTVRWAAA